MGSKDLAFSEWLLSVVTFVVVAWVWAGSAAFAGPIRIQCVGDSTTAGYTDNPRWRVQFDFGYRLGLYKRFAAANYPIQFVGESPEPWSGEYGYPQTVGTPDLRDLDQDHHRGYAWLTADKVRTNIVEWMTVDNPDVILLMIGRIDLPYGFKTDVKVVANSLSNLVQTIVNARPEVYLIVAEISPYIFHDETMAQYNRYIRNELVPSYASQGKRVSSADLHSNFLLSGGATNAIDQTLFADGYAHPDSVGNDRIAQTWFDAIVGLLPPIRLLGPPVLGPNGSFQARFAGRANSVYQLDRSTALEGPWEVGFTNLTANAEGIFELEDSTAGAAAQRFYRVTPR